MSSPHAKCRLSIASAQEDAMVAGVLHGILQDDFAKGIRYGALTAALALSHHGDLVITTREELDQLLNSNGSTDIYR